MNSPPFLLTQLLERGACCGGWRPFWKLFGSLNKVARRLPGRVRFVAWEASWFDPRQAAQFRLTLDSQPWIIRERLAVQRQSG